MVSNESDCCFSSSNSTSPSCQSVCNYNFSKLRPLPEMGTWTRDSPGRPLQGDLHPREVGFPPGYTSLVSFTPLLPAGCIYWKPEMCINKFEITAMALA